MSIDNINKKIEKLNSIENLRAFLCISVFICHFKGAFFPKSSIANKLMETPLSIVFNGNIPVRLMFIISGIVISYKFFTKECYDEIVPDIVKRYFRLGVPVAVACLFSYYLMKVSLMRNLEVAEITQSQDFLAIFNNFVPSKITLLKEMLYSVLFFGSSGYVGPMWTMSFEMYGSILILASLYLLKNYSKVRILYYIFTLLLYTNYYSYFVLGMAISDFVFNLKTNRVFDNIYLRNILIIFSGLYLSNPVFPEKDYFSFICFSLIAFIFFTNLLTNDLNRKNYKSNKLLAWFSKHSFAIYLLHWPIIESFSCIIFLNLYNWKLTLNTIIVLTFISTLIIITIFSALFYKYIERTSFDIVKLIEKIVKTL